MNLVAVESTMKGDAILDLERQRGFFKKKLVLGIGKMASQMQVTLNSSRVEKVDGTQQGFPILLGEKIREMHQSQGLS